MAVATHQALASVEAARGLDLRIGGPALLVPLRQRKNRSCTTVGTLVKVDRFIPAAPEVVWDLLVDTTRWPAWGPSITAAELDHDGSRIRAGSTGRVRTAVGVWVPFRVTEFDDGRRWSWVVAGIPATSHSVDPAPGGCRVGFGVPLLAAPYALVCRAALERIDRLAQEAVAP
ncbi:MAG: SRPBCC family protein [Actinobacteria bacterium]|nr:SRPBCC family protein [Actinomycetota bacterium]